MSEPHKRIFWDVVTEKASLIGSNLYGWVIGEDHYHLLIHLDDGTFLKDLMHSVHGKSSFLLNKFDNTAKRRVWFSYWDTCIRTEEDFYTRLNYIHHNPIKHKLAGNMTEYQWSSYNLYLEQQGQTWLDDCFARYSIKDFTLDCAD
jgi:putative transposase